MNYGECEMTLCVDCTMWHANAEPPPEMDEETFDAWRAEIRRRCEGLHVAVTGDDSYFATTQCDSCGSRLGGDRVDAIGIPTSTSTSGDERDREECDCTEEYGPCENHCEVLAQREGASTRTADDLLLVWLMDARDIVRETTPWLDDVIRRADEMLAAEDHYGCRWLPADERGERMRDEMTTAQWQLETSLATMDEPAHTYWDDGYVISRTTGGPLHEHEEIG